MLASEAPPRGGAGARGGEAGRRAAPAHGRHPAGAAAGRGEGGGKGHRRLHSHRGQRDAVGRGVQERSGNRLAGLLPPAEHRCGVAEGSAAPDPDDLRCVQQDRVLRCPGAQEVTGGVEVLAEVLGQRPGHAPMIGVPALAAHLNSVPLACRPGRGGVPLRPQAAGCRGRRCRAQVRHRDPGRRDRDAGRQAVQMCPALALRLEQAAHRAHPVPALGDGSQPVKGVLLS